MENTWQTEKSLLKLNTFGVEAKAKFYVKIEDEDTLVRLAGSPEFYAQPLLILGGGSNILFTQDFQGLVIHMCIGGIEVLEKGDEIYVTAGGGVVWNYLVQYCVDHGYAGIENLSLIPGTVGAAPVQNIGAYGVELMDVFASCRAYDIQEKSMKDFDHDACQFSYRDSFFKNEGKGRYIITEVTLRLNKTPELNLSYGAIQSELERRGISEPSLRNVAEVVSEIRVIKLHDTRTIGNSGSFFKNPIISAEEFQAIEYSFPDIVYYPVQFNQIKLAADWLIENCGWKGKRVGNTGTWKNQALVLVNYGNASGSEVYSFSERIIDSVYAKFGVRLEREVNTI